MKRKDKVKFPRGLERSFYEDAKKMNTIMN
jgi:hypothetical protein